MTEEKLSQIERKFAGRRWVLVVAAAFVVAIATIWLVRQPVAESIGRGFCKQQKLYCEFHITRLDFGGVTIRDIEVRKPEAAHPALTGGRLAVDLDWTSLVSARPAWVGGEALTLRLDLSGARPLLGDLDETVKRFTSGESTGAPMPRIALSDIRIVGDTPLGPVEARGALSAVDAENFTVDFTAPTAQLALPGAEIRLAGGELKIKAQGDTIAGRLKLGLERFETNAAKLHDVNIDLSLDQSSGVLKAAGLAGAREIAVADGRLAAAQATAGLESDAINLETFTLARWLAGVERFSLSATTGEGAISGAAWKSVEASADINPDGNGASSGPLSIAVRGLAHPEGSARSFDLNSDIVVNGSGKGADLFSASGAARLSGGSASVATRTRLAGAAADPIASILPAYASAARDAIRRASADFDVVLPFALNVAQDGGYKLTILTGAEARARSGMSLILDGEGQESVAVLSQDKSTGALDFTASGAARLAGGGGPTLTFVMDRAAGSASSLAAAGSVDLRGWRVAEDAIAGRATNLEIEMRDGVGDASGAIDLQVTGAMAGAMWTRARISGTVSADWAPDAFTALAPKGVRFGWDEVRFGDVSVGRGELAFAPAGPLAVWKDRGLSGSGRLAAVTAPVTGRNFSAEAKLAGARVNWSSAGTMRVAFDADALDVRMMQGEQATPIRLGDLTGEFAARNGWRLAGRFADGSVRSASVDASSIAGVYSLSGAHGALDGDLRDVTLRLSDPLEAEARRFEDALFEGQADLDDGVADFSGAFTLAESGVQIANVSGEHNLSTGIGSLSFAPTPLIFRPRSFEPSALSPLLRGPAEVTGRVDVSGGASWTPDGLSADATVNMQKLGFTLASAGVFEGVSGKIEIADLLNMESAPGQQITIDKVTLGMPIEKGVIRFQLAGFDIIRLEAAEWPFAGGFIRVLPVDFGFTAESNRVIAQAVNWDLARIVELFKVPDVKIDGRVSGQFPVVFSTGSARIEQALLQASQEGGVIQYGGSTGDAAASADANAKMLFDALKNFRYRVLKAGLDGDIAGRIVLTLNLQGSNPDVLQGAPFDLNISIDSALMELLGTMSRGDTVSEQIIDSITGGRRQD